MDKDEYSNINKDPFGEPDCIYAIIYKGKIEDYADSVTDAEHSIDELIKLAAEEGETLMRSDFEIQEERI